MSKLRASISYKHRINEAKAIQQQQTRENIAEPIVLDDNENNEEHNENNEEYNEENNEENYEEDNES